MSAPEISEILAWAGLGDGSGGSRRPGFDVFSDGPVHDGPVLLQVSRRDPLKDTAGVPRAFVRSALPDRAQLVLCGPAPSGVAGDPEAGAVLDEVIALRHELPPRLRRRVHPLCTPLADDHGNSLLVNAPQRRADIVVQRSVQEAFGLTATETLFKARPVGGIPRQITSGQTGLPLKNPGDGEEFTGLVGSLLDDRETAAHLGRAARKTAQAAFTVGREAADNGRIVRAFRRDIVRTHPVQEPYPMPDSAPHEPGPVWVVGASSGFGFALAQDLAQDLARAGRAVTGLARSEPPLGAESAYGRADVTDPAGFDQAMDALLDAHGAPSGLVYCPPNTATVGRSRELDTADLQDLFEVTYLGFVRAVRRAVPAMIEAGRGSIVLVGPRAARIPMETLAGYASANAAAGQLAGRRSARPEPRPRAHTHACARVHSHTHTHTHTKGPHCAPPPATRRPVRGRPRRPRAARRRAPGRRHDRTPRRRRHPRPGRHRMRGLRLPGQRLRDADGLRHDALRRRGDRRRPHPGRIRAADGREPVRVPAGALGRGRRGRAVIITPTRRADDPHANDPHAADAWGSLARKGMLSSEVQVVDVTVLDPGGQGPFLASQAAIDGLVRAPAVELAAVAPMNAVAPGIVPTDKLREDFQRQAAQHGESLSEFEARTRLRIPTGVFQDPSAIAAAVAFLLSPAAVHITGQVLAVDRGMNS